MTKQSASYWWSGPICGLGNRLIAIAAVEACIGDRVVHFPWSNDPSCPGDFDDVFAGRLNLVPADKPAPGAIMLETHGWEPLTIYRQLNTALGLSLSLEDFCRRLVFALRGLRFRNDLVLSVQEWRAKCSESLIGVHIRRTDRTKHHREQFRAFLMRKQGLNRELPFYLSAMYGLCPTSFMRAYENALIVKRMRRCMSENGGHRYAVVADDAREAVSFEGAAAGFGAAYGMVDRDSLAQVENVKTDDEPQRKSDLRTAATDLLRLSRCDVIAQGNRASTFSLVAAIIGAKPIITPEPLYPFWRAIHETTGFAPNSLELPGSSA